MIDQGISASINALDSPERVGLHPKVFHAFYKMLMLTPRQTSNTNHNTTRLNMHRHLAPAVHIHNLWWWCPFTKRNDILAARFKYHETRKFFQKPGIRQINKSTNRQKLNNDIFGWTEYTERLSSKSNKRDFSLK